MQAVSSETGGRADEGACGAYVVGITGISNCPPHPLVKQITVHLIV